MVLYIMMLSRPNWRDYFAHILL